MLRPYLNTSRILGQFRPYVSCSERISILHVYWDSFGHTFHAQNVSQYFTYIGTVSAIRFMLRTYLNTSRILGQFRPYVSCSDRISILHVYWDSFGHTFHAQNVSQYFTYIGTVSAIRFMLRPYLNTSRILGQFRPYVSCSERISILHVYWDSFGHTFHAQTVSQYFTYIGTVSAIRLMLRPYLNTSRIN